MVVSVRIYVQFSVCARCVFVCASVYFEEKEEKKEEEKEEEKEEKRGGM